MGLFQIGIIFMPVGDIVFAPFKESMWPGRIVEEGVLSWVKFFKIKDKFKVPTKSLVPFTESNI